MEPRTRPEDAWEPWESPYEDDPFADADAAGAPPRAPRWDFRPLFMLLEAVRRGLPHELQQQFTVLLREFLLTVRSLIDSYLERLDAPRREPEVEDIPID